MNDGAWRPTDMPAGDVLTALIGSDARLAELRICNPLAVWNRKLLKRFTDPEIAENRAFEGMFVRPRARRRRREPANYV